MKSSFISWILSSCILLFASFYAYPKWSKSGTEATISWDVSGYYYYLPALFIYNDLRKLGFKDAIEQKYSPAGSFYQAWQFDSTGDYVMKYSIGQAILYSPAFGLAQLLAVPLGFPADGFSLPYQFALQFWSVLVAIIGLWYLRKVLNRLLFREEIVGMVLLTYILATNYLNYAAIDCAMSHNYLFTLNTLLLWNTILFYQNPPSLRRGVYIGMIVGLSALTRPTEIIGVLIPLLWGVSSMQLLKNRFLFFIKNFNILMATAGMIAAIGMMQLLYWKCITGHWLFYSYGDGQTFSWLKPHLLDGLISMRKGWLTYTPIMFFSLLGFYAFYRRRTEYFWAIFVFILLFIWISFAWDIWWYGGSLGQRQMVQAYPVLALTLAAFYEQNLKSFKKGAMFIGVIAIYLNIWWHYQAHGGGLFDPDGMTKAFFWRVLGRWEVPVEARKLLDNKYDFVMPNTARLVYENDFERDSSQNVEAQNVIQGRQSLFVDATHQNIPEMIVSLGGQRGEKKMRAMLQVRCTQKEWDVWKMGMLIVVFQKEGITIKDNSIRLHRLLQDGETKSVWIDAKIPPETDRILVKVWNGGGNKKLILDDLNVYLF